MAPRSDKVEYVGAQRQACLFICLFIVTEFSGTSPPLPFCPHTDAQLHVPPE